MIKPVKDIERLESLLSKYKFADHIPVEVQESILSSKKNVFLRVMKTVGSLSFLAGIILTIYFYLKKVGIGIITSKFIISTVAVASVTYGGYRTVVYVNKEVINKPEVSVSQSAVIEEEYSSAKGQAERSLKTMKEDAMKKEQERKKLEEEREKKRKLLEHLDQRRQTNIPTL